jgi:hypothetical protein
VTWAVAGLLPSAILLWIIAAVVGSIAGSDPIGSTIALLIAALGAGALLVGIIGLLIVRRTYGPTGKVLEPQPGQFQSLVELGNVHPAFVAAVQELQHLRAQQAYRQ